MVVRAPKRMGMDETYFPRRTNVQLNLVGPSSGIRSWQCPTMLQ
jgi:hypothetical protein